MVAAAYDQSNAFFNTHAGKGAAVRQIKCYFHGYRGPERNSLFHRKRRNAGFSRKNGAVCHKCHKALFLQGFPDRLLVVRQKKYFFKGGFRTGSGKQGLAHTERQKIK